MNNFWTNLKESNITQLVLTVMIWGLIGYMLIAGNPVPEWLVGSGLAVLGFFFGIKQNRSQLSSVRDVIQSTLAEANKEKEG